jgi:hypothetical protein
VELQLVLWARGMTGTVQSAPVRIPAAQDAVALQGLVSAPPDERNVYDLLLTTEVEQAGVWVVKDVSVWARGLAEAGQPVHATVYVRVEQVAGTRLRCRLACGQSWVAVAVVVGDP